jgi:2-oxoglutarate ferredoxin oxidoreductase subunit alpha
MKADPGGVLTGAHFIDGDHACAEGAIAAGCRFSAGYPITPSTEVVERLAARFPAIGGVFIQMEDELASSIAIQGAVWGGVKAITVTSGPGFSLMMEHLGLAVMAEVPLVIVDVQRGGPSTGLPTLPAQSDLMQARWGSHGDYEIIALCPQSPQECFDLTIRAFNLSEEYRVPVLVMLDECVGHMIERVEIPEADQIEIAPRKMTSIPAGEPYEPFKVRDGEWVPDMTEAGAGHFPHITGLTHDDMGYPAMNAAAQGTLVRRLCDKINHNAEKIIDLREDQVEDADVIVVSFGITARVCLPAIEEARERGLKVGFIRMVTIWPFPERRIRELAESAKGFVVVELNLGQMVHEVERCAGGKAVTRLVSHAGGAVHSPGDILHVIEEVAK